MSWRSTEGATVKKQPENYQEVVNGYNRGKVTSNSKCRNVDYYDNADSDIIENINY